MTPESLLKRCAEERVFVGKDKLRKLLAEASPTRRIEIRHAIERGDVRTDAETISAARIDPLVRKAGWTR